MHLDFDAGKYAIYIWPAFALTAATFAWMVIDSLLLARRWKAQVERQQARLDDQERAA